MEYKLSILICHLPERRDLLMRLLKCIDDNGGMLPDVEILVDDTVNITTGRKRNELKNIARGRYLAFIDDDDLITEHYFPGVFEGIAKGVDCCSLTGIITDDGKNPRKFIHSLDIDRWHEKDGVYYRNINHLNAIRSDLGKQISYPDKTHGEDHEWSTAMQRSGLLKTQHEIKDVIYLYEKTHK